MQGWNQFQAKPHKFLPMHLCQFLLLRFLTQHWILTLGYRSSIWLELLAWLFVIIISSFQSNFNPFTLAVKNVQSYFFVAKGKQKICKNFFSAISTEIRVGTYLNDDPKPLLQLSQVYNVLQTDLPSEWLHLCTDITKNINIIIWLFPLVDR